MENDIKWFNIECSRIKEIRSHFSTLQYADYGMRNTPDSLEQDIDLGIALGVKFDQRGMVMYYNRVSFKHPEHECEFLLLFGEYVI